MYGNVRLAHCSDTYDLLNKMYFILYFPKMSPCLICCTYISLTSETCTVPVKLFRTKMDTWMNTKMSLVTLNVSRCKQKLLKLLNLVISPFCTPSLEIPMTRSASDLVWHSCYLCHRAGFPSVFIHPFDWASYLWVMFVSEWNNIYQTVCETAFLVVSIFSGRTANNTITQNNNILINQHKHILLSWYACTI